MEIQLNQIIFQIINFSVVVGALAYLLYKPIIKILEERADKIASGQKAAEKNLNEQENIEKLKKQAVQEGQKEANKIISEAKETATKQANKIKADAKKEAEAAIAKLKEDFQDEKKSQLKMMKKEFNSAVIAVSEKVISQSLTEKKHQELIDKELESIFKAI